MCEPVVHARRAFDCRAWLNQGTSLTKKCLGVWSGESCRSGVGRRSGVGQRGGYLCDGGGGICERSSHLSDCGCSICYRGSDFSYRRGEGGLVDDGVESVDRVSGVLDGPHCAVRLHQAVAALDDVSTATLLLALSVAGQSVLDVVSVAVLGVGVVVGVDGHRGGDLSDGWGGISEGCCSESVGAISQSSTGGHDGGRADDSSAGDGHQGGEGDELEMKVTVDTSHSGSVTVDTNQVEVIL